MVKINYKSMPRKKQLPITDSDIKLIRKANEFVEARYKFDIWETRVFAYMLTLIKYSDTDFAEYKINVGDIVREFGLNKGGFVYEEIKKASEKLLSKRVQIERITAEGITEIVDTYLVVSTARPKEATKDNYIKLRFHSDLKPFLIELKQRYLVYDIRNILSLTSIYSIRLFELLKQYQKIGKRRFAVDELKSLLSIEPDEYTLYGHFKDRIIKKAQKDLLQHTDIYFEFEEETEKKKVFALTFYIYDNEKNQRVTLENIPVVEITAKKPLKTTPEDVLLNTIFEKVNKFVSKRQVKKWVQELPIEQIENGITYTINYVNAGNEIKNIGGFLNTMVYTPNLFDKYEEKKTTVKKITKKQQTINTQIATQKQVLEDVQAELIAKLSELEGYLLSQDKLLMTTIHKKLKNNLFYDVHKTLEENLQKDSIKGLKGAILEELSPEYKALCRQYEAKLRTIKDELYSLGYRA
jgi:plasmid replication initiation protein